MDEIRIRLIPSTASKALIKSKKVSPVDFPKSPIFTPVKMISLIPDVAIFSASFTKSVIFLFLLFPRASGIVQ